MAVREGVIVGCVAVRRRAAIPNTNVAVGSAAVEVFAGEGEREYVGGVACKGGEAVVVGGGEVERRR